MDEIKEKDTTDLLNGSLFDKIIFFAMPIAFSSILQQLFNSADSAVVGRFSGNEALAAVGANGAIISLFVNLFAGLSVGANVVIATYIGSRQLEKIKDVVHSCITLSLVSGAILAVIGQFISRWILEMMGTPNDCLDLAVLYLRIYFLAMPFILLYNYGAAILRSKGDTKRPLYALFGSGIINVILNLVLVIIFGLGVMGVAIATLISNVFSSLLVLWWLTKEESEVKVHLKELTLNFKYLEKVLSIGLPAGLQGAVFAISNICIQSAVNAFGSVAVAGNTAELNFENLAYYFAAAFSQTVVTFVSQNFAAGKYDRCKKSTLYCLIMSLISCIILGTLFNVFANTLLKVITTDSEVIIYAEKRMKIAVGMLFIASFYDVLGGALRALGHSLLPAMIVVFGTCIFRLIWVYTVVPIFPDIETIFIVYPISWTITSIVTSIFYIRISRMIYNTTRVKKYS